MTPVKCFHIDDAVPYLKASYRRMALVAHRRHVERLDAADDDTLIVSSDWLLWQECLGEGRHCVHTDHGVVDWDTRELDTDLFLMASDWIYVDGRDATLFRGVSLGRKFVSDVSMVIGERERLKRSLETLTERFAPRQYLYFDHRTIFGRLDGAERFSVVAATAEKFGVEVTDLRDTPAPDGAGTAPPRGPAANWKAAAGAALGAGFERLADAASRVRRILGKPLPGALILNTHLTAIPMIESFDGAKITPMFLARWFPRKRRPGFLIRSLAKGILLIGGPERPLSEEDHAAVEAIHGRLEEAWKEPATGREAFVRSYVRKHILKPKRMIEAAERVIWAAGLLDRHTPACLLTDGLLNPTTNTFLELAKQRGIPAAATWHGPHLQDAKTPIFGSDPREEPLVDCCFTWGRIHEDWLDATSARVARVRTGSPVCAPYLKRPPPPGKRGRVLVLQFAIASKDFATPISHEYTYFVETVRMLQELGYSEIRIKLHPGMPKPGLYRRIADLYGLDCEIHYQGPFADFVAWADFVIGPAVTSAVLEVMAAGKTYYQVLLHPHPVNTAYLDGYPIHNDLQSLRRALQSGEVHDCRRFLNNFTSIYDIPDPAARVWEALRELAVPR